MCLVCRMAGCDQGPDTMFLTGIATGLMFGGDEIELPLCSHHHETLGYAILTLRERAGLNLPEVNVRAAPVGKAS